MTKEIEKNKIAKIRSFFAILLQESEQKKISKIITLLKKEPVFKNLKWTKPKNFHITLRFLGNITEGQCSNIINAAKKIFQESTCFDIDFTRISLFPHEDFPIALVLKPRNKIELNQIALHLDTVALKEGAKMETKSFHPHITLARTKNKLHHKENSKILNFIPMLDLKINVCEITLLQSEPTFHGSRYKKIETFRLREKKSYKH